MAVATVLDIENLINFWTIGAISTNIDSKVGPLQYIRSDICDKYDFLTETKMAVAAIFYIAKVVSKSKMVASHLEHRNCNLTVEPLENFFTNLTAK